jgi:hypothetical protein
LIVAVMAATVMVAGCTAAPADDPTPPPTGTPSAEPTEPELTEPRTALALSCDELFGLAELQPLLTTPVQVRRDESSAPLGVRGASLKQAGTSLCVYGGENRTDSSYDQGLRIQAVPGAAAGFDTFLATTSFPGTARMDTIGDRSVLTCQGAELSALPQYRCWANFVVGDFWVEAWMSDDADVDSEGAADLVTTVLTTVAGRMAESGPQRALWTPPTGSNPAPLCSDPAASAALLGEAPESLAVADKTYSEQGVPIFGCTWSGSTGAWVGLTALESGSWAVDAVAASPGMIFNPRLAESERIDIPNTDGALLTCTDSCYALVSWQGTLVEVAFDEESYDPAVAAQRLQAWGAALP